MFLGLEWYWWLIILVALIISIPFKVKFMKWWSRRQQEKKQEQHGKWGDDINTEEEVHRLHDAMVMDYTEKMRKYFRSDTNSKHINACKEYIYSHIKERITIEDLADVLGVSASYLSRLFKKEVGVSVSSYIRKRKIEMAKNLLRFSDYSMIEIANRLSFSSQSHFIQQFREVEGITPKRYRDEYYMVQWDLEEVSKTE